MNLSSLIALIGNLLPLAGVWLWGWDPFQLLMLYWMETVIVAGWTLARIAVLPKALLGRMKIDGREVPATNRALFGFFGAGAAGFILGHFLLLWVLFPGDWSTRVRGPVSFVRELVVHSGAWIPLLFLFLSGAVAFLTGPTRPQFVQRLEMRFRGQNNAKPLQLDESTHGLGAVVGGMFGRIAIMQVGIICGAWFARSYGSMAPMLIVIGIKTLFDLCNNPQGASGFTFKSGDMEIRR